MRGHTTMSNLVMSAAFFLQGGRTKYALLLRVGPDCCVLFFNSLATRLLQFKSIINH